MDYNNRKDIYSVFIKRLIDIVLSLVGVIVLFPLLVFIGVLIKIELGSPVIFKQIRPGFNEKPFVIYKFRSMKNTRDKKLCLLPDGLRITKFGSLLRQLSIDELPELFNILKGDLSIVGPRPLLFEYLPFYSDYEKKRHSVRPGLTGLSQIMGRNNLNWDKRLKMDVLYVEKMSITYDLKIIMKTLKKTILKENVQIDTLKEGYLNRIRRSQRK
jgi:lipopolysaccharide/colanic/teichoic acid biosynthesis glycosyltransferase